MTMHWVFPVQYCLESLGQYCTRFLPMQCCPNSTETTLKRIFSCALLSGASRASLHRIFYLCHIVPRVLRQHWTWFFPVKCCLESLGQHYAKFLPVQCCPKRIKTTLKRIFSSAMLSEAWTTTLHRAFSMQCCPKSINTTLNMTFSCAMLSKSLGQHYTRFFHVQCYPSSIKITLHRIIFRAMLSQASWATLHKVFTCAMLSQEYWDNIKQDFFLCIVWSFKESTT